MKWVRAIWLFAYAMIAAFLWLGPLWTIASFMVMGTVLLAGLGLLSDVVALRDVLASFMRPDRARRWRNVSMVFHLTCALVGVGLIFRPVEPQWTHLIEGGSDLALAVDERALYVVDALQVRRFEESRWTEQVHPGGFTWVVGVDDGSLWIAPRDGARLLVRNPQGVWLSEPRPLGHVQAADRDGGRWVVIAGGRAWDSQLGEQSLAYDVAISGGRVLTTGYDWWFSEGAAAYREVTPEGRDSRFRVAAGGGQFYAFESSSFGGELWVGDGERFEQRVLPTRDVRRVNVDDEHPDRAIAVSWGQGVHLTEDAGRTWRDLGHWGSETRSVAVDWPGRRVFIAPSNMIGNRGGVWVREF